MKSNVPMKFVVQGRHDTDDGFYLPPRYHFLVETELVAVRLPEKEHVHLLMPYVGGEWTQVVFEDEEIDEVHWRLKSALHKTDFEIKTFCGVTRNATDFRFVRDGNVTCHRCIKNFLRRSLENR